MSAHILAAASYGAQRVIDPASGKPVSAYKLGYTTAVSAVLLALYGGRARRIPLPRATYHYLHIDAQVVVRHGHILLSLTPAELRQAEAITRHSHRAGVFVWRDGQWWALPDSSSAEYRVPGWREGPGFDPTGLRPPSPSSGERAPAVSRIIAERGPGERGERACWWLSGGTWPHRDVLRQHGARFSSQRKAWYYHGAELPAAIRALVEPALTQPDDPCTLEEAAAILGVRMTEAPAPAPPRLFALHDTAYARYDLETAEGTSIPTGTRGSVVRLYQHNARHGWSCEVDFEQIGPCWAFERELTPHAPIPGVRITRGAVVPPGAQPPPTDAEIRRALIEDGLKPAPEDGIVEPAPEPAPKPGVEPSDALPPEPAAPPADEPSPAIRIHRPAPLPAEGEPLDAVQTAIRESRAQPPVSAGQSAALTRGRLARIEQAFVGELSGSITGQVFCYGYALHDGLCVYVNMAGPRVAVEAIRARLSKGDIVTVVPPDAPAVELTAGEGNSGIYHACLHALPEARFASLILVHDWAVTPNYGGKATTFLFRTSEAQAIARLRQHVMQLVSVPVFEAWASYLYEAGQRAMLVRKTRSAGGIDLLSIDLDVDAWTRLITGGLEQRIIRLPQGTV
jgi:hypothetical protein